LCSRYLKAGFLKTSSSFFPTYSLFPAPEVFFAASMFVLVQRRTCLCYVCSLSGVLFLFSQISLLSATPFQTRMARTRHCSQSVFTHKVLSPPPFFKANLDPRGPLPGIFLFLFSREIHPPNLPSFARPKLFFPPPRGLFYGPEDACFFRALLLFFMMAVALCSSACPVHLCASVPRNPSSSLFTSQISPIVENVELNVRWSA